MHLYLPYLVEWLMNLCTNTMCNYYYFCIVWTFFCCCIVSHSWLIYCQVNEVFKCCRRRTIGSSVMSCRLNSCSNFLCRRIVLFGTYCSWDVKICISNSIFWAPITLHVALKMYQNWARPKIACGVMCCNVNGIIIFFWIGSIFSELG